MMNFKLSWNYVKGVDRNQKQYSIHMVAMLNALVQVFKKDTSSQLGL